MRWIVTSESSSEPHPVIDIRSPCFSFDCRKIMQRCLATDLPKLHGDWLRLETQDDGRSTF